MLSLLLLLVWLCAKRKAHGHVGAHNEQIMWIKRFLWLGKGNTTDSQHLQCVCFALLKHNFIVCVFCVTLQKRSNIWSTFVLEHRNDFGRSFSDPHRPHPGSDLLRIVGVVLDQAALFLRETLWVGPPFVDLHSAFMRYDFKPTQFLTVFSCLWCRL